MPLNEHEERILHEIEQRFYAHDPDSARRIESTTLDAYLARNCRWAAAGFVILSPLARQSFICCESQA